MRKIEIKADIPAPGSRRAGGRPVIHPFDLLKPGQHFDVLPNDGESLDDCARRMRSAASAWRRRKGARLSFVVRNSDDFSFPLLNDLDQPVVRVWAVEPGTRK